MIRLLSIKINDEIADIEVKLEKAKSDILKLEKLKKRAKISDMLWPFKVNVKNAEKFIKIAEIIKAFQTRSQKSLLVSEVVMTTKEIWNHVERPRAGGRPLPSSTFRSHLSLMKKNNLLDYDDKSSCWRLTEKSIQMLELK